jgi:hypothetical protein
MRRKRVLAAALVAAILGAAIAARAGSFLFTAPLGPTTFVPIGPSGGQRGSGGGSPPPICSNALDFSQACNSQYLFLLLY